MGRFRLVTPSSFQLRFNRADNRHTNCRRGADKWGKVPACRRAGMMGTAAKSDEANFGGQSVSASEICRPKTLACCGPKCAALEPMSRSSESLFQPLELERAPEESLARRGMERHDVAGPPVTAALVPS